MNLDTVLMLEELAEWHDPSRAAEHKRQLAKESARWRRRAQYIDRLAQLSPPLTAEEKQRLVRVLTEPSDSSP